jgi:hypothetical protein
VLTPGACGYLPPPSVLFIACYISTRATFNSRSTIEKNSGIELRYFGRIGNCVTVRRDQNYRLESQ